MCSSGRKDVEHGSRYELIGKLVFLDSHRDHQGTQADCVKGVEL